MSDLNDLFAASSDADVAAQLQQLTADRDFDPLRMLAGKAEFLAVFIAPFSPALNRAVACFLADGTGPLQGIVESFRSQGAPAAQALSDAQRMISAAVGMCVVVLGDEQGLTTVPQLFFGNLAEPFRRQVVETLGKDFPFAKEVASALDQLAHRDLRGNKVPWHEFIAPSDPARTVGLWSSLARRLGTSLEQGQPIAAIDRLQDLAHWIAAALGPRPPAGQTPPITVETAIALVRCQAFAGEYEGACARLGPILQAVGPEASPRRVELVHHIVETAIAQGRPGEVIGRLASLIQSVDPALSTYDVTLALFKLQIAAQADAKAVLATLDRLVAADKRAWRHDLTREPLWRVTITAPGELLDTAAAAIAIGRSPTFVAKRLEQGTIPSILINGELRLPAKALATWKAVMDAHHLLD